jgi:hypothetical protein
MHVALLQRGAKLLIGTCFPVPQFVGGIFMAELLKELLLRPVLRRDLAEVVRAVRRRLRRAAALYSLKQFGLIDGSTFESCARDAVGLEDGDEDPLLSDLERQRDLPANWRQRVIPYPLFFSVLGFPWNTRTVGWGLPPRVLSALNRPRRRRPKSRG